MRIAQEVGKGIVDYQPGVIITALSFIKLINEGELFCYLTNNFTINTEKCVKLPILEELTVSDSIQASLNYLQFSFCQIR